MERKLFKWIGGKKWLSKDLIRVINLYKKKELYYYAEPFAGGLGSFFSVINNLKKIGIKKFYINDVNYSIIALYETIKAKPNELYSFYKDIELEYLSTIPIGFNEKGLEKKQIVEKLQQSREYYNSIKERFNKEKIEKKDKIKVSAYFLFLMQHCFNGVYRENSSGLFNVSYNWEIGFPNLKNKKETLFQYHKILNENNITFSNIDAIEFIKKIKKEEDKKGLFYCDPPYYNSDKGENRYSEKSFGKEEQFALLDLIFKLENVIYSNHYDRKIISHIVGQGFRKKAVLRRNTVSSKKSDRKSKIKELLAYKKL
tara:strand:+ start:1917 stop:2855 length:939 start_codon:yes stop_codon:yes gene_type:complete